jgi:hypothetical protein
MSVFPLSFVPRQDFTYGGLAFGNDRGTVDHAACDLIAPAGTPVLAMDDGVVWYTSSPFFQSHPDNEGRTMWTYEMAVVHANYIVRYGEIAQQNPPGVRAGAQVTAGQQIGTVGAQVGSTMLHLEMFHDTGSRVGLTQRGNMHYTIVAPKRFNRRSDLRDPTGVLLILAWAQQNGWQL